MKLFHPIFNILDIRCDGRDNAKNSVGAFPLWSLQKQNGRVQRNENNMKDIMAISITYWHIHL